MKISNKLGKIIQIRELACLSSGSSGGVEYKDRFGSESFLPDTGDKSVFIHQFS